jgi:hypothetical protein
MIILLYNGTFNAAREIQPNGSDLRQPTSMATAPSVRS